MTVEDAIALRPVSRETKERLAALAALVRKWSPKINLVSPSTLESLWERHILDSLQVFDLGGTDRGLWVDLGSGGGFPGAVVALVAADEAPDLKVTLVESDQRKATFLRTVSRETGVPFGVVPERIESLQPMSANVLSARALAPLDMLLGHVERHLDPDGIAVFPKGARHDAERVAAEETWSFEYEKKPSVTDPAAAIYRIRKVHRV